MPKGYHHSAETRRRMSLSHKGVLLSVEHRRGISEGKKGISNPECYNQTSFRRGHAVSREVKGKISEANKGREHSQEEKEKRSASLMGRLVSEETRKKLSQIFMGRIITEEHRAKMSRAAKLNWRNSEFRDKTVRAQRIGRLVHPNKPEIALLALLESAYPGEWAFVGDGTLIIDGFNPDFVNVNGQKKIVEMFGNYWHGEGLKPNRRSDEERIRSYASLGYSCLVIWESELKEPEKVLDKIKDFA